MSFVKGLPGLKPIRRRIGFLHYNGESDAEILNITGIAA
jgi:hypothetical protein